MSAKLRHIAISVPDVQAAQTFFEEAFGMTKAGDAGRGVYMTDGVMNVALLDFKDDPLPGVEAGPEPFHGLYHFGMWVEDLEEAKALVEEAGAEFIRGRQPEDANRYYEVKYKSPDGLVFDITTSGWAGAVRDPERRPHEMSEDPRPVIVAGAGPVGLVLALALGQRGHRVTVVERLVDIHDQVRRAGTVHPATLEMLDDLGLYEMLEPRGLIAPLVHYWDRGQDEPIAVFDHAVLRNDTRFPYALQCDRLKIIEEAVKLASSYDSIEIHTGTEMVGFSHDDNGVTVTIERADGSREELAGSYLVSGEGAHSIVRSNLDIEFEGFAFPDRTMTLSVLFDFDEVRPYGYRNYILDPQNWANLFKWTDVWRVVLPSDPGGDPAALLDDAVIEATLQRFHAQVVALRGCVEVALHRAPARGQDVPRRSRCARR